jgi:uncharacterized protein (TIGR00251 family)
MSFFWEDASGCLNFLVKVKPNAKKSSVDGICDVLVNYPVKKALRISVSSPAQDGKANAELVKVLSKILNINASDISLERGDKGRIKLIKLSEKVQTSILASLISIP